MPDVVCIVCDGKDFYNEAGFYYCNECQTQTQELREQVFVQQDNTFHLKTNRTYVRSTRKIGRLKITSWETFNYIMVGLADEMVNLGASNKFRIICCRLWLMYLSKLEIMSKTPGGRPKLNACFKIRDAEIVYNRKMNKRRIDRKPDSACSIDGESLIEAKLLRKQRNKQRKKLIKEDYDKLSEQKGDEDLHNRTLESLQTEDESDDGDKNLMIFSASAKKELLKHMTPNHLKLHMSDLSNTLSCHKINHYTVTASYSQGPYLISRVKLHGIMYLALLLSEDTYQLSDMLRFFREGNLSLLNYKHFFPEVYAEAVDESVYLKGVKCLNAYSNVRKVACHIFQFLGLPECSFRPDLNALCKRYCYELNLPDEICNLVLNIIKDSNPQFPFKPNQKYVPNYEGRIICIIIFVMKLLYGLDGKTEFHLSKFAKLINDSRNKKYSNAFVWEDWYSYIERRKSILKLTHFPTKYLLDSDGEEYDNLFINFIFNKYKSKDIETKNILPMNIAQKNLEDLHSLQEMPADGDIDFPVTTTPFRTYIETLQNTPMLKIRNEEMRLDSLKDFANCSVDFLIYPSKFLKLIKANDCTIVMGGANTKVEFSKMRSIMVHKFPEIVETYETQWETAFGEVKEEPLKFDDLMNKILEKHIQNVTHPPIEKVMFTEHNDFLVNEKESATNSKRRKLTSKNVKNSPVSKRVNRGKWFVSNKVKNPKLEEHIYNPSLLYQVKKDAEERTKLDEIDNALRQKNKTTNDTYPLHYIPRYDFWINIHDVNHLTVEGWEKYFNSLPPSFRWLIEQCSLIVEQKPQELFLEYVMVETFLTYVHYNNQPVYFKPYSNYVEMLKYAKKAKDVW